METFTIIPDSELLPKRFEEHPVWASYYEPEDMDCIVSWGIERELVERLLKEVMIAHPGDDYFFPVLGGKRLMSFMFLHIKADFVTADGTQLNGWVGGADPHCIGIFLGEREFLFNHNMPKEAEREISIIRRISGLPLKRFFPLHYSTEFEDDEGNRIEGEFGRVLM
jgi:hypothetical protein